MATGIKAADRIKVRDSVENSITAKSVDVAGTAFKASLMLALIVILSLLLLLLGDVIAEAAPYLSERGLVPFLTDNLSSKPATFGISQAVQGTVWILVFVAGIAFPIGVAAAVYLEEYAKPSRMTRLIDVVIRNLAGVPSVVYGILGLVVFKELLGTPRVGADGRVGEAAWWQFTGGPSLISAGLTMAILVLPIVIITSAEALRAVPKGLKEAGYGVGATRSEVIRSHMLPYAAPGILTGTVLALARAIGEAAPLLMVGAVTGLLSSKTGVVETLQGKFTALPMVVFSVLRRPASEGWPGVAAATILVLIVVLLLANGTAIVMRNRFEKKRSS